MDLVAYLLGFASGVAALAGIAHAASHSRQVEREQRAARDLAREHFDALRRHPEAR